MLYQLSYARLSRRNFSEGGLQNTLSKMTSFGEVIFVSFSILFRLWLAVARESEGGRLFTLADRFRDHDHRPPA